MSDPRSYESIQVPEPVSLKVDWARTDLDFKMIRLPPVWHLMLSRAFLWDNGESRYIAGAGNPLTYYLESTVKKINFEAGQAFSEEQVDEILENVKAVKLTHKFPDNLKINQLIPPGERDQYVTDEDGFRVLEKFNAAIFILEDDLHEDLEGIILVNSPPFEEWSVWRIRKENGEIDNSWIEEIQRLLEEPTPIPTPTPAPTPMPKTEYLLAEVKIEATVIDVNKTFILNWEPETEAEPSPEPENTPSPTPVLTPLPTPAPFPPRNNITPYDVYDVTVILRVDSIIEYQSDVGGLLKEGDDIVRNYSWTSPHYVNGELVETMDLKIGERIKTILRIWSSWKSLDEAEFWKWSWNYQEEVNIIERETK